MLNEKKIPQNELFYAYWFKKCWNFWFGQKNLNFLLVGGLEKNLGSGDGIGEFFEQYHMFLGTHPPPLSVERGGESSFEGIFDFEGNGRQGVSLEPCKCFCEWFLNFVYSFFKMNFIGPWIVGLATI